MNILLYEVIILFSYNIMMQAKGCLQKKKCWEGDIGPYGREGGKKDPLFLALQKGDLF